MYWSTFLASAGASSALARTSRSPGALHAQDLVAAPDGRAGSLLPST